VVEVVTDNVVVNKLYPVFVIVTVFWIAAGVTTARTDVEVTGTPVLD